MPSITAYIAIIIWPFLMIWFFSNYPVRKAILLSMFGSYMFLPVDFEINFPGIPAFDKFTTTTIALLFTLVFIKKTPIGFRSLRQPHKFFLILLIVSPIITALNNKDPYLFIQGLNLYDGVSLSASTFLYFFPFLIGYHYFRSFEDHKHLFKFFAISVLIYAILAVYEIRMSPQLHAVIYGYFPHSWVQQMRGDGFRAVIFMGHGLSVAMFLAVGIIVVNALRMCNIKFTPFNNMLLLLLLLIILVMQKSLLALMMAILGLTIAFLISYKKVHYVSFFIAIIFFSYPLSSSMKIFPHDDLVNYAAAISTERAESLNFRFIHEENLLNHANQKPIFGWGGWGRNRIYDHETGEDYSVTDGDWILTLGSSGWIGFIAKFYFVFIALFVAYRACKLERCINKNEGTLLSAHVLIVAFILLDQMPNASLNHFYIFICGSLLGRSEQILLERKSENLIKTSDVI